MQFILERKRMAPILVRLARQVACHTRLRILREISQAEETTPTALSAQLHITLTNVTEHLQRLMAVGLITRRAQSRWNFVKRDSAYSLQTPSGRMAACLHEQFTDESPSQEQLDRIFHLATTFTHPRRLRILTLLAAGAESGRGICENLDMSPAAASRHITKLSKRGFVCSKGTGVKRTYHIVSTFPTPLHTALWETFVNAPSNSPRQE